MATLCFSILPPASRTVRCVLAGRAANHVYFCTTRGEPVEPVRLVRKPQITAMCVAAEGNGATSPFFVVSGSKNVLLRDICREYDCFQQWVATRLAMKPNAPHGKGTSCTIHHGNNVGRHREMYCTNACFPQMNSRDRSRGRKKNLALVDCSTQVQNGRLQCKLFVLKRHPSLEREAPHIR